MKIDTDAAWFRAWQRSNAYGVPMSLDGIKRQEDRMYDFKIAFEYGIRSAASTLEVEHSKVKKQHRFFYIASQNIRDLIKQ